MKNMSIKKKLILALLVVALGTLLLCYVGLFAVTERMSNYVKELTDSVTTEFKESSQETLLDQAADSLHAIVQVQTESTDNSFKRIREILETSSDYIRELYANEESYLKTGTDVVMATEADADEMSGRYILDDGVEMTDELKQELLLLSNLEEMFEPGRAYNDYIEQYFATPTGLVYVYTGDNYVVPGFDARERDWYKEAVANPGEVVWVETYIEYAGKACISAAEAVRSRDGELLGVMGADIIFDEVMDQILADGLGESGTNFMLGNDLDIIASEEFYDTEFDSSFDAHFEDPDTVREELTDDDDEAFFAVYNGSEVYMASKVIPETGWIFCAAIDKEEVLGPVEDMEQRQEEITAETNAEMKSRLLQILRNILASFLLIGVVAATVAFLLSRYITEPIKKLTETTAKIGQGDFDSKIDIDTNDEIGELASNFNRMQDDLKNYTENLQTVTAEKERISADLNVAKQIQADMLPRIFPPFPDKEDVDIYATMDPAKEVGGDFYDFFIVDDDHLAFVIADVSGKGVPAALFMVISKTLIKNRTMQGGTPAEILADVNNQLCEGNEAEMFVTAWLAILELSTGRVTAANAGHEFPAIRDANGNFSLLKDKHGFVMAGMEGVRYKDYEIQLEKGGGFFVYTDGVPEATNSAEELFGTDRMISALNEHPGTDPTVFLKDVKTRVTEFTGEAPQFDDITMIGLVWQGEKKRMSKLVLDADVNRLSELQAFLEEELEKKDCPMKLLIQIQVAAEEIFTNIASYAYGDGEGTMEVNLGFDDQTPATMSLQFVDSGVPFDPLAKEDPDVTATAEERKIGGLGIYMVKKSMDEVSYEYADGHNVFTMKKKLC